MLQFSPSSNAEHQMLDMMLTVLLIENLCALCWRGIWGYLDISFMPDRPIIAAILNAATGFSQYWKINKFIFRK